ncbi:MAG: hypothetical protein ABUL60_05655 [Myxococcales bacterium]
MQTNGSSFRRFALLGAFAGVVGACSSTDTPSPDPSPTAGAAGTQAGTPGSAGSNNQTGGGSVNTAGASGSAGNPIGGNATSGSGSGGSGQAGGSQAGGSNQAGGSSQAGSAAGGTSGTAGAGAGGAASSLCPAHAQLCLDFENGAFTGWNKKESGGTVSVDKTHFSHGSQALLISVPTGQAGGLIENHGAPLFPLPQKQLWGRMMVYFEGVPDGHTDLARGNGGNGGPNYNVGEQHDSIMLNYYAGSSATDCWARPKPEKKVPDKTWMCWEWRFDSAKNQMDFWMDGTLLRSVDMNGDGCLTGNGVWQAPPTFESISVGELVAEKSNSTAYKAWIDDVAVSNSARVGCPAAP